MLKEYFAFLDGLRESGAINMFGAATVLQDDFGLSKHEAREIVSAWMEQFKE